MPLELGTVNRIIAFMPFFRIKDDGFFLFKQQCTY
jgi:hypothetical protein